MSGDRSLFDGDDHDQQGSHPLVGALSGIEAALAENTRAIEELTEAVRRVLDDRGGETAQPSTAQPDTEPDTEPDADLCESDVETAEAGGDRTGGQAEVEADSAVPDESSTGGYRTEQSAVRSGPVERAPVERPALWDELAGFDAAAVVGPGFVQIGARRWSFEVHTAAEIVRIAGQLQHRRSAPQIWVLTETCEELGLVTYPDDVNRPRKERITSVEHNLAQLPESAQFLAPALDDGWKAGREGQLEPWTLLRSPQNKIVHVVLEPYTWMYDHDGRGIVADGGDDEREYPNAITGTPQQRADEILRRVRWIDDHLSVLPDSNPGRTVQRVIDADRRKKLKAAENDGKAKTDSTGRNLVRVATEPGRVPEMDGSAELGLDAVAPELVWPRIPTGEEIDAAEIAIELDQRYAYFASMSSTQLGLGEPRWVSAEEAAWTIAEGKPWFGAVRCEPRARWHEPRVFPPHPGMTGRPPFPHWVLQPTVDIARDDEDKGGGGWSLEDLGITGAYLWPDTGRLMEPFYNDMRPTLLAAEQIEDPALRAATVEHLKGGYKSLTGKWEDINILNSGHRTYRYQPMHRRQLIAATSARLFRQVRRIELRHRGLWPVHAVTDGVWYLASRATAETLSAETADAKFGQLRPKHVHELSEADRSALRAMSEEDKIISVPHVLNLGTAEKGR